MKELKLRFRSPEQVLREKITVSDTGRFTASSAPISCFDPARKVIFTPYHASYNGYGEQASVFALARTALPDIKAASSILMESDVPFYGQKYNWPIDGSSIMLDGKVRIFFLAGGDSYYRMDWSPEEENVIGPAEPVLCCTADDIAPRALTRDAVEDYLKVHNCTGYDLRSDVRENIICTAKPAWSGNQFYGAITSFHSQPILYRCRDGKTFEFCGIIPALAKYECQVAVLNGKIYALLRGASGDEFWVADENEWQFRPCGRLGIAETRPQLFACNGKLLLAYSRTGILPNKIRDGRNNITILAGDSEDLSQFKEVFHAVDEMGIVYYDIVNCNGDLYMIWSNSERFPDKLVRGVLQGKDTLYCSLLAEKTEE